MKYRVRLDLSFDTGSDAQELMDYPVPDWTGLKSEQLGDYRDAVL